MKRIALIAALAALLAAPAWAQSEKAAAPEKSTAPLKLPAKAEGKAGAMAEAPNLPTTDIKPVYRKLTKRSYLDARECLTKKTDEEIIICAEKFL
jgi:hypothetical protein